MHVQRRQLQIWSVVGVVALLMAPGAGAGAGRRPFEPVVLPAKAVALTHPPLRLLTSPGLLTVVSPSDYDIVESGSIEILFRLRPGGRLGTLKVEGHSFPLRPRTLKGGLLSEVIPAQALKVGVNRIAISAGSAGGSDSAAVLVIRAGARQSAGTLALSRTGGILHASLRLARGLHLVRATLNGRRFDPSLKFAGDRAQTMAADLAADDALRFGVNRLRLVAYNDRGAYGVLAGRVVVDRLHPLVSAGSDRIQVARHRVRLDASSSRVARSGDHFSLRWAIVRRPTGSRARLSHPFSLHPTLTPDRRGVYRIRLVATELRPKGAGKADEAAVSAGTDQVVVDAQPALPPAGAQLTTIAGSQGGVQLCFPPAISPSGNSAPPSACANGQATYYGPTTETLTETCPTTGPGPSSSLPMQIVVIGRQDLECKGTTSFGFDFNGANLVNSAENLAQSSDGFLVISAPHGVTINPFPSGPGAQVLQALMQVGLNLSNGFPQGLITLPAFSAITYPASTSPLAVNFGQQVADPYTLLPDTQAGDLTGTLLTVGSGTNTDYQYASAKFVGYSTSTSGSCSTITVGNPQFAAGVVVATQHPYNQCLPNDSSGNPESGYQVLLLDGATLQPLVNQAYPTNGAGVGSSGIQQMVGAIDPAARSFPTRNLVLIVQSIGSPAESSGDTSLSYPSIASALRVYGATRDLVNRANFPGQPAGGYAFASAIQEPEFSNAFSEAGTPVETAPGIANAAGTIGGELEPNPGTAGYMPADGVSGDYSGPLGALLNEPLSSWPYPARQPGDQQHDPANADLYILDQLLDPNGSSGSYGRLGCGGSAAPAFCGPGNGGYTSVRQLYTSGQGEVTNNDLGADIKSIPAPATTPSGFDFNQDDFLDAQSELALEATDAAQVISAVNAMYETQKSAAGSLAGDLGSISTPTGGMAATIDKIFSLSANGVSQKGVSIASQVFGYLADLNTIASGISGAVDEPVVSGVLAAAAGVEALGGQIATSIGADGVGSHPVNYAQVLEAPAAQIESTISEQDTATTAAILHYEPVILTDYGKLLGFSTSFNTLNGTNVMAQTEDLLRLQAVKQFFQPLLPLGAALYDLPVPAPGALNPANGPGQPINKFSCFRGSSFDSVLGTDTQADGYQEWIGFSAGSPPVPVVEREGFGTSTKGSPQVQDWTNIDSINHNVAEPFTPLFTPVDPTGLPVTAPSGFFPGFGYNEPQFLAQVFGSWTDPVHKSFPITPLGYLTGCHDDGGVPLTYPPGTAAAADRKARIAIHHPASTSRPAASAHPGAHH